MSLDVKTFDGQINVFSTDHGAMQRAIFGQQDCIVQGCDVTISDNKIYVSHGWMVICGRLVLVNGQEIIEPDDIIATNGYIRLILNIDTSIAAVEGLSTQISWSWDYSATTTFTALTQEDVNVSGSVYKAEIAVAQISSGNITTVTRELMTAKCLLDADVIDNFTSTDVDKPASANRVKLLNDGKVNISDIQDNFTSTDVDKPASAKRVKLLNDYVTARMPLAGGTFTGGVTHNEIITQLYTKFAAFGYLLKVLGSSTREFKIYWTGTGTGDAIAIEVVDSGGASHTIATIDSTTGKATFSQNVTATRFIATYFESLAGMIFKVGSTSDTIEIRTSATYFKNYANSAFSPINASAFTVGSSKDFKKNIKKMTAAAIKKLLDINLKTFAYKTDYSDDGGLVHMGIIAEELAELFPDAVEIEVEKDDDGADEAYIVGIDYSKLVVPCIGMIQQHEKKIMNLEKQNTALKKLLISKGIATKEEMEKI